MLYKTATCPKQPLLSGPKSGHPIQVWLLSLTYFDESYIADMISNKIINQKVIELLFEEEN